MNNPFLRGSAALLAALLLLAAVPARAQEQPAAPVQWIDVHVHPAGRMQRGSDFPGAVEAALKAMPESNMARVILMPTPQDGSARQGTWSMEDFLSAARKHPNRIAYMGGGGTLNPMIHDESRDGRVSDSLKTRFRARALEILDKGAVGFGEMSVLHFSLLSGHPYERVEGDHPLFLLLADISGERQVPIDIHFDPVVRDLPTPEWLPQPDNPPRLKRNIDGFERLLAHNRKSIIVWAHAGSDSTGHWTVELSREMLRKHPNLFMSIRMGVGPAGLFAHNPLSPEGVKPEWIQLLRDFPDRFVIGGDQFFAADGNPGPAAVFAKRAANVRSRTNYMLAHLPPDLARKIGYENAVRIYKLKP